MQWLMYFIDTYTKGDKPDHIMKPILLWLNVKDQGKITEFKNKSDEAYFNLQRSVHNG